ncbi:MAG: hypothetical protein EBR72_06595 [Bacteroidetes bacterium]|nr:hypothetical protein [Bacteroidota bacterium]
MSENYYQEYGAKAIDAADTDITEYITKTIEKYNEETGGWEVIGQINDPHENPWTVPHIDTTQPGAQYKIRYNVKDVENRAAEEVVRLINIRQQVVDGQMNVLDGIVYRYVGKWQGLDGKVTTDDYQIDFLLAWHGRVAAERNAQAYFEYTYPSAPSHMFYTTPVSTVCLAGDFDESTKEFAMFQHNHHHFDNPNYIMGRAAFAPYGDGAHVIAEWPENMLTQDDFDTEEEYFSYFFSVVKELKYYPPGDSSRLSLQVGTFFNYHISNTHVVSIGVHGEYGKTPRGQDMPCTATLGASLMPGGDPNAHGWEVQDHYYPSTSRTGKISYLYEIEDGNFDITLTDTGYDDYLTGGNITNLSNIDNWDSDVVKNAMWMPHVFEKDLNGDPIIPEAYNELVFSFFGVPENLKPYRHPMFLTMNGPISMKESFNLSSPLDLVFNLQN